MLAESRQMKLIAFLQAQNCAIAPATWRHPASMTDFLTAAYFQRIGRVLEEGKFHMAFFDDRLAMPDIFGDSFIHTVAEGIRPVKMDLISIMTAMGMATSKLGIGGTYSTTYYEPFHVARTFATLDLMIGGRAAWNIVTSLNDSEAANFGRDQHLQQNLRYDRADEFMEVVLGHWGTWDEDAILLDKANMRFADPAKVHRLDYEGKFFKSRGPFTVPRSPQGHPLLLQAGQSGRGREFAGRWAELIFTVYPNLELAKKQYKEHKESIAAAGRDPDSVPIAPACYVIVAESADMAQEKKALVESLERPYDRLVLLSELLNFDFASKPLDEPLSDEDLRSISFASYRERVLTLSGKSHPSAADFARYSGQGTLQHFPLFCGTPSMVADQMEEWFRAPACDGFVVTAAYLPGAFEDFVRLVVPELQKRGLFHNDYPASTLRENLGMSVATAAQCRRSARPVQT